MPLTSVGIMAVGKLVADTSISCKTHKASGHTGWLKPLSEFTSVLWLQAFPSIHPDIKVSRPETLSFTRKHPEEVPQRKKVHSILGVPVMQFGTH